MQIRLTLSGNASEVLRHTPARLTRAGLLAAKRMAEDYTQAIHDYIDAGRSFVPRTGHLEQSINWMPTATGAEVYAQSAYAGYVETGTRPHVIRPKPGRDALRFPGRAGGFVIRRSVAHPGSLAMPYFFADLDSRKQSLLATARETFAEVLNGR